MSTLFPGLAPLLDADAFQTEPGTYIDEELQERQSDVLLRTRLANRDALIYVLVEHQRTVDPLMAVRMLRYQSRIWDRYLTRNPKATRIPVILTTVIYHGDRPWTAATDLRDLFALDPAAARKVEEYLPRAPYRLDDLTEIDLDALRDRPLTPRLRLTLTLLKVAPGNPRIVDLLTHDLNADLAAVRNQDGDEGLKHVIAALTYIMNVTDVEPGQLLPVANRLGQDTVEAFMTTTQRLREEGRVEGRVETQVATLLRLLTIRFGPLPDNIQARVRTAIGAQLDAWTDRVLTATTLDDVFD